MKIFNIILTITAICSLSILSVGCSSAAESDEITESQTFTVQRGDLVVDITAAGNLKLSRTEDLSFEMAGTVEAVLVDEGDTVVEGQVLARLDASEWENSLATLETNLIQAEINLINAEDSLSSITEVAQAQDTVDEAEADLRLAQQVLQEKTISGAPWDIINYYTGLVNFYQQRLTEAQQDLASLFPGTGATSNVATQIILKKLQLELAQRRMENDQEAVSEALSMSLEIIAPFDGFIVAVNVDGGDMVHKGTIAFIIADPSQFEADILVSELDILQVTLEGEAYVQVDALQGVSLPAQVTHISPTAIIQQGVVNYRLRVEIQPLQAAVQKQQQAMPDFSAGEGIERLKQAVEEGRLTQEQADEILKRIKEGLGGRLEQGGQQGPAPLATAKNLQLRAGLTVTVSIIVDERSNVLLVPNGMITNQGRESYVQVLLPDSTTEERAIQTGISNWQYTEVTDGLNEGEQIVVSQGSTTSTTSQQQPRGGLFPGRGLIK